MTHSRSCDGHILTSGTIQVVCEKKLIGSYVGNRQDSVEALDFAASGRVGCRYVTKQLDDLPKIFDQMRSGQMVGRGLWTAIKD